jgi:hypothetical protein
MMWLFFCLAVTNPNPTHLFSILAVVASLDLDIYLPEGPSLLSLLLGPTSLLAIIGSRSVVVLELHFQQLLLGSSPAKGPLRTIRLLPTTSTVLY